MNNKNLLGKITLALFSYMLVSASFAQEVKNYIGEVKVSGMSIPISLSVEELKDTTIIKMGSPSQTKQLFSVTKQRIEKDSLLFSIKSMNTTYKGRYNETKDTIKGNFKQGYLSTDLVFVRTDKPFELKRPQEPKAPLPYMEEELSFHTPGVDYTFNGTLSLPSNKGKYPCVILITGSGLQNRDEEIMGHKPFKVIADYLTRNNIAVFRYDDRGWGSSNTELFNSTTLDFVKDAQAAFELVSKHPNINANKIGLLGHSEGGIIAPMLAAENEDINFIVLLAGTGIKGIDVLIGQNKAVLSTMNQSEEFIESQIKILNKLFELIEEDKSDEDLTTQMDIWFDENLSKLSEQERGANDYSKKENRTALIAQIASPWFRCFLKTNPQDYLSKVKQPVLILNGDKDIQVIYTDNVPNIEKALKKAGNKNVETYIGKSMNHLFQECKECSVDEYSKLEQTISTIILERIKDFILKYSK